MGWGPLDRLGEALGGVGGAFGATGGFVYDLARSPFVEDDYEGILGTLNAVAMERFGDATESLFGPESGWGALIGGMPEIEQLNPLGEEFNPLTLAGAPLTLLPALIRSGGGPPAQAGLAGLETAGEYGIRRPITTASTINSLMQREESFGGRTNVLFDPGDWQNAWNISEERSPGQAVTLMLSNTDILDEDEVTRFAATDAYQTASGLIDAAVRLGLEPDLLIGKALKAGRLGRVASGRAAVRGQVPIGTMVRNAPPQIGRKAETLLGPERMPRITEINNRIDRAYQRLPRRVRETIFSAREFETSDVSRLERLDATRRELEIADLERQAGRTRDPVQAGVLRNVAEQRRVRGARVQAGALPSEAQTQFAETAARDIDAYLGEPPAKGQIAEVVTGSQTWQRVNEFVDTFDTDVDTRAGMIRDRLFPTHPRGDVFSRYLAEAQSLADRDNVMRVFLGDQRAVNALKESDYALGQRLQDFQMERATIRSQPVMALKPKDVFVTEGQAELMRDALGLADEHTTNLTRIERINEEIDAVRPQAERNRDLRNAAESMTTVPSMRLGTRARNTIKNSTLYQTSMFGRPVRTVFDMRPGHIVGASDPQADAHLGRMLREAGFGDEEIHQARGRFFQEPNERKGVAFEDWVQRAEQRILEEHGLGKDEMQMVLDGAAGLKREAQGLIRGSKYDGEGRARVQLPEGGETLEMPLFTTQLSNQVTVPNFRRLRHEAARYARLKYGDNWRAALTRGAQPAHRAKLAGQEGLRWLMDTWKVGVLLRPAWTIRVIADEQLRMIAKFGALSVALNARGSLHNYASELRTVPGIGRVLRNDKVTRGGRAAMGALAGATVAGPAGAAASLTGSGIGLGRRLLRQQAKAEMGGHDNLKIGGMSVSGPFGSPGTKGEYWQTMVSARGAVNDTFGTHENWILRGLKRDPGSWRTHAWGDSEQANAVYKTEWARQVRTQIAQDEMGRQLLEGKTVDEVVDWMDNTLEGRRYASLVPYRWDHQGWVEAAEGQVNAYTGGREEVKRAILEMPDPKGDKAMGRWERLLDQIPEETRRPIHGAELSQTFGVRNPITQALRGFVDHSFNVLGNMPTDALSRQPTFKMYYQAEMRRRAGRAIPGDVHKDDLARWEGQARDFALRETRELLYDMAERSEFSEMVRTLIPFYPAWQEVLTRWAGLVAENPKIFPRAREIWKAPNKAGWVHTNDEGEEFIRFRLPEFAQGLLNQGVLRSAIDSQGYVNFDKGAFNMVLQGTPGFGPIAQVAVSEMVKQNPSLEESVKFILPFGPTGGLLDPTESPFMPPTFKRALATRSNDEGAARANAMNRIITTKLTQMALGDIPEVDMGDPAARAKFLEGVESEVNAFMSLRMFAGFVAPVAPIFESPFQNQIDVYRAIRDGDFVRAEDLIEEYGLPVETTLEEAKERFGSDAFAADDIFMEVFGEEYFALTQSFSESLDGIPPTVEGLEAGEQFGELITRHPEWGGVIAGYDGGGEAVKFSRAVYDRQLAEGTRRRLEPDEVLQGPDVRLGWSKYSRYMDMLEAVRVERGLPNMQVAEAEDLAKVKQIIIAQLARDHPAWHREFQVTDRGAMERRLEGAREIAQHPDLQGRPDIQGLGEYLQLRDAFSLALTERASATLDSEENQDLAAAWLSAVGDLVERNPEFADLFYRKLERDRPEGIVEILETT